MSRARWRTSVGMPAIAMGTAALTSLAAILVINGPAPIQAAAGCQDRAGAAIRTAAAGPRAAAARVRVSDRLSSRAVFAGRRLQLTTAAGQAISTNLPAESHVSEAVGNVVIYTQATAAGSQVRAVDLLSGCDYLVASPAGIARSAILAPDGLMVYVHTVNATDRADEGVARHSLETPARARIVMPAVPDDAAYGPTFGTQLAWSTDGSTLAVQSCGIRACRTRTLEVATGRVQMFDANPHGTLIGVTREHVITFAACHWSPCAVLSTDRATGDTETLADEAFDATLSMGSEGRATLTIHTAAGTLELEQ